MNMLKCIYLSDQVNEPAVNLGGIFKIQLVNTTGQFESTATAYLVPPNYNGVNITCSNKFFQVYSTITIAIGEKYNYVCL